MAEMEKGITYQGFLERLQEWNTNRKQQAWDFCLTRPSE
jgi:hypothetical protein